MKNLNQYIYEKLTINKHLKHDSTDFLNEIETDSILLDTYWEYAQVDLKEFDFTKNVKVFDILSTIYDVGGKSDLIYFFYYIQHTVQQYFEDEGEITEEVLFNIILDADLSDFEDWIERLR